MKFYIKIIILLTLTVTVGVGGFFAVTYIMNQYNTGRASKVIPPSASPAPYTGDLYEETITTTKDQQFGKLVNSLPITTQSFAISMDFSNNIIMVTIIAPYEQNYTIFHTWLVDNGFDQVPQEKFQVNYQ